MVRRRNKKFEGQVHVEAVCDKDRATREQLLHEALEARIRHHEEAGFRRSEMAILVRTNKQGAHIAQHLLDVGITPQTEDSLHLGRHPGALAVVALTRWVVDPSEDRHATSWLQCMAALSPRPHRRIGGARPACVVAPERRGTAFCLARRPGHAGRPLP